MTGTRLSIGVLLWTALLVLPACGGGGQGLRVDTAPLLVTSTSIPPKLSGESVNHVIPIAGGCGGPYVLKVISGKLPRGLYLDNETHAILGHLLEDGDFSFTIQVTDTGCEPFSSTTASFRMVVGVGEIVVVGATLDGNPTMVPPGGTHYNPDHPSLGKVVYNDFVTILLVVAGGHGPYSAVVIDKDGIDDGPLPLGTGIPPSSTSITGAPVEVGPEGGPFLVTLDITDSVGGKGIFTFYWMIDTPQIIFATPDLLDGQAGVKYSDQIIVAEGVGPFVYEFVEEGLPEDYTSDKSTNPDLDPDTDVIYNPGAPPTVNPPEALVKIDATVYPPLNDLGPAYDVSHQGAPPEAVVLTETTGSFSGIPRRRGTFSVNAHVQSTLVPNSFGQHAWGTLDFEIVSAPPIAHDPIYTLDPAFTTVKPYARLEEAQKGQIYNPDGGPDGLQIVATGGVPDDGLTDAPHASQTEPADDETAGAYKWEIDWNPDGDFDGEPALGVIPGMEFTDLGIFRIIEVGGIPQVDDLIPQFDQSLAFTAADSALPDTLASSATEKVAFGIGPDRILITKSTTTMSNSTDQRSWDDSAMTLKYVIPQGSVHQMRSPGVGDLTGDGDDKHLLPSEAGTGTTPATLFTSVDLLRTSVNPTGYWDDNVHLNPNAARPWQNSQTAYYYPYYGPGSHGTTSYSSGQHTYGFQPATTSVRLSKCKDLSVTASAGLGVYTDGGKLHAFDTSTHFGIFIIRKDGRLYVPAAFKKSSSGYASFGDNWSYGYRGSTTSHSATKIPQMTVSPDGRIAALKVRTSTSFSRTESAGSTDILLISLTGERIAEWDDEVYTIVESGSSGSSSTGQYLFASSLTLTNEYLYYLIGSGSTNYLHYKDHYIYRYGLFDGEDEGEFLHPSFNSEWTNTTGSAMQTPFQCFARNFAYNTSTGAPDPVMYGTDGYNSWESSLAPHPFRVNSQGNACAILAGRTTTATSAAADVLFHHVWVDYEGDFHQLSTQRRHTSGGGRGIALKHGPCYTPVAGLWGDNTGPTSRFEISDDGLKVAVVYFRNTTVDPYVTYSETQIRYREDIAAYVSTNSSWGGRTVHEITGDTSTNTGYGSSYVSGKFLHSSSSNDQTWRFGALTFTTAGDGLIFWGGYSNYDPDAYSHANQKYTCAKSFVGSLYSYDFTGGGVRNILAAADGGCNKTVGTAYTSYTFSQSSWQTDGGVIKPAAGFRSQNGDFLYIATRGAVYTGTSKMRDGALIGVNVRSVNAAGSSSLSINGHRDGRAFYVGFPSGNNYNGFLSAYYPYSAFGFGYTYSSAYQQYYTHIGYNSCVAAPDNGWVYFTSVTAANYTYTMHNSLYGGPVRATYSAGYPYYKKRIFVFDPNVGGAMNLVDPAGWTGLTYQHVQGLVVSDDGSAVMAVDSTYTSYHYIDRENFTVFSGIDLNETTGSLPANSVTMQKFETSKYVGDCAGFSPKLDSVYYAAGSGSASMTLKRGTIGGNSTGTSLGFGTARYSVLHTGR